MIVRYKRRAEQQYNPENNVDYYNSAPIGSKPNSDTVTERNAKNGNNKQRLPSFISHPNGIVLRVFKRQRSMIQKDQDQRRVCAKQRSPSSSVPSFICHPNGIVLRVLNQKQPRIQSPSRAVVSARKQSSPSSSSMEVEMTSCAVAISIRNRKISTSLLSSSAAISMVKIEMETQTDQNGAEQRVKQLKRVKQRVDRQHYSHVHHWPPQQQYKSKSWTIAIILKLIFVAWDSWTYRIGY